MTTPGWLVRLWLLVAVLGGLMVARSVAVGIPPRDPGGAILVHRLVETTVVLLVAAVVDAVHRSRTGRPARWTGGRVWVVAAVLCAYCVVYFSYHNHKSWVVLRREGAVLPVAACVAWALGAASYYAVPSLGPFWSSPADFRGLPHTRIQGDQAALLAERAHLLAHPGAPDAFSAVAAFASLHVAMTSLLVLAAANHGQRRLGWCALVLAVLTAVATIYLGWHFVADDLAGLAIAFVAILAGQVIVFPGRRPRLRATAPGERRRTIHG